MSLLKRWVFGGLSWLFGIVSLLSNYDVLGYYRLDSLEVIMC